MTLYRSSIISILALALILPLFAFAADFKAGEQPSFGATERVVDDLYMAGGNVTSSGTIVGDLLVAGGNVLVNGSTSEDVFAAGGTVSVLGSVGDDLRAAGGNVIVQGAIASDAIVTGGQVTFTGPVRGDIVGAGGTVRIEGAVGGDIKVAAGSVYINNSVAGNVEVQSGQSLELGPQANITGALSYQSPQEVKMAEGARVGGEVSYTPIRDIGDDAKKGAAAFVSFWLVASFLMLLAGALLFGLAFRTYAIDVARGIEEEPLKNLGIGFVTLVMMPIVSIFLLVTVIGIPLGILGLVGFVGLMIFVHLFTPVVVGSYIMRWFNKRGFEVTWLSIVVGVIAVYLIGLIPLIGGILRFLATLAVIGMVIRVKWRLARRLQ